ncbi:MAG: hypothetical protein QM831_10540 [Kofleriaceae bacterium]
MRVRDLAGQSIATVGLGDVSFARSTKRGRDAADVMRRMHEALDKQLDVIDVAPEDDAERAAADAMRAMRARDHAVIATRIPELAGHTFLERLPIRYVRDRVEAVLRATKLEVLPLVQLPLRVAWRDSRAWAEFVGSCALLVREGKVLRWGARLADPEDVPLVDEAWLASIAIEYAMCARDLAPILAAATAPVGEPPIDPAGGEGLAINDPMAAMAALPPPPGQQPSLLLAVADLLGTSAPEPVKPRASVHRPVVFACRPLQGGALAGTLGPGGSLAPLDDRRALSAKQLEEIAVGVARLASRVKQPPPAATSCEAARSIVETTPRPPNVVVNTIAELALRYVIDRGCVALPRVHQRADLDELVACGDAAPLPEALLAKVDEILAY